MGEKPTAAEKRAVWIIVGITAVALWFGVGWLMDHASKAEPEQTASERRLPVVTRVEMEALSHGIDKQLVFNRVGRGVQETSRVLISGKIENCWLWRESEQRDDGRYPLWSVCFEDTKLISKGRYFDE